MGKYDSVNYLNGKDYIDNELRTLDVYITSLQTELRNLHTDNKYNSKSKYLHSIRRNNPKQLTERIKNILSYDYEANISSNDDEYFDKYIIYVLTTDSQDIIKNNYPQGNEEQINKYQCIVCNIDYRNPQNYNKHIRYDDTCSICYRLKAILPNYFSNDGCREFSKTNTDLNKHMSYHFPLTDKAKLIFHINNQCEITFNRKIFERHGPPNKNTFIPNGSIFYDAANKTWQCQICNKKLENMTGDIL